MPTTSDRSPAPFHAFGALFLAMLVALGGCTTLGKGPGAPPTAEESELSPAERRERAHFKAHLFDYAFDRYNKGPLLAEWIVPQPEAIAAVEAARRSGAPFATWIGHSTFLIEMAGARILTDPIYATYASPFPPFGPKRLAPPGLPFDSLPPIDLVLVSHNHFDHLDLPTLRRIAARNPEAVGIGPTGTGRFFAKAGFRRIVEQKDGESTRIGGITVDAAAAKHNSGRSFDLEKPENAVGFFLRGDGVKLFFAGDTAYDGRFRRLGAAFGPLDAALVPIGAYVPEDIYYIYHVNPEDALRVAADLRARTAIAMHWGTYALSETPLLEPPRRFLAGPSRGVERIVPRVGETIFLKGRPTG